MKKVIGIFLFLAVIFSTLDHAYACTSFAVYSDETLYGMNFDYPETDMKFIIEESNGTKAFFMQFKQGNSYSSTVGMNAKGLFVSTQMLYPKEAGKNNRSRDELFVPELNGYIKNHDNVQEILQAIDNKRLVQLSSLTLHNLFADADGNAVITEAGKEKNELLSISGGFMVMTNFKNSDYTDKPYDEISATGSDRYIKAYKYMLDNKADFHFENAQECLKMTVQNGSYPTLLSMVFSPEEKCVYAALHQNFEKLWRISIEDKSIETWKGFEKAAKFVIPDRGVFASDLISGNFKNYQPYDKAETVAGINAEGRENGKLNYFLIIIAIVTAAAVFCIYLLLTGKQKKSK